MWRTGASSLESDLATSPSFQPARMDTANPSAAPHRSQMGGKSTYLRQNALLVVLSTSAFVPAKRARIGVTDASSAAWGRGQLRRGLPPS